MHIYNWRLFVSTHFASACDGMKNERCTYRTSGLKRYIYVASFYNFGVSVYTVSRVKTDLEGQTQKG